MIEVVANEVEATVSTSLVSTDTAGTSRSITVTSVTNAWPNLASGQQLRVVDKADLLAGGSSYEVMGLTADNSGAAGTWTLTRGLEGTVKSHGSTSSWTLVPTITAANLLAVLRPYSTSAEVTASGSPTITTTPGEFLLVDCTSSGATVQLPSGTIGGVDQVGLCVAVQRLDATTNSLVVVSPGPPMIPHDSGSSLQVTMPTTQYTCYEFIYLGSTLGWTIR